MKTKLFKILLVVYICLSVYVILFEDLRISPGSIFTQVFYALSFFVLLFTIFEQRKQAKVKAKKTP